MSRAKIDLAKRAEEISRLLAGRQEDTLNSELANLSVMMTQTAAQIIMLEPQLSEAEVLLERADRYEVESLKLTLAKRNLEEAIIWRDRMSRKIRMLTAPIVIVMGAQ